MFTLVLLVGFTPRLIVRQAAIGLGLNGRRGIVIGRVAKGDGARNVFWAEVSGPGLLR